MDSKVIPELDITWFKDDKKLKELKTSCDLGEKNKWKTDVEALDNSFKTLTEIVSTDQFSNKTDWTPDTKLAVLGKFYSEFSSEKQKFMDLMTTITSMMKTKAQEELLAHQTNQLTIYLCNVYLNIYIIQPATLKLYKSWGGRHYEK